MFTRSSRVTDCSKFLDDPRRDANALVESLPATGAAVTRVLDEVVDIALRRGDADRAAAIHDHLLDLIIEAGGNLHRPLARNVLIRTRWRWRRYRQRFELRGLLCGCRQRQNEEDKKKKEASHLGLGFLP